MALQVITPEWLTSLEGKLWIKKLNENRDKIIADYFNRLFIKKE